MKFLMPRLQIVNVSVTYYSVYYCSQECPIGKEYVPEVTAKDLSMITLEMLSTLNILSKERDRMIDIAADEKVTEDFVVLMDSIILFHIIHQFIKITFIL